MSRSYKHTPCYTDGSIKAVKFAKKRASRKTRKTDCIPNGNSYRKVYNTYNIHDIINYCPLILWSKLGNRYGRHNWSEKYRHHIWCKYYFRK